MTNAKNNQNDLLNFCAIYNPQNADNAKCWEYGLTTN